MSDVSELVNAIRADIKAWGNAQIMKIQAEHGLAMQALMRKAKADLQQQIENMLAQYQQTIQEISKNREDALKRNPEFFAHIKSAYDEDARSAKERLERSVAMIKKMYKTCLGVE